MAIDFDVKDILHKIQARFIRSSLPDAKKPYNLKTARQPELNIHELASKAEVYNIGSSPKAIEEGLIDGLKLMSYLAADGYKIVTPYFTMKICLPGEYDGSETSMPHGLFPVVHIQTSAFFRNYIKANVTTEITGMDKSDGFISESCDEATETADEAATIGNLLTIHGFGLKIEDGGDRTGAAGLYFEPSGGGEPVKAQIIAVNEPKTLKIIVPNGLEAGKPYTLKLVTKSSAKGHSALLKKMREVRSEFSLTAHV
ncbi:MAG: DUF4469 domain-containing protein [Treponema sp.]|jgi:hypothetical protein|nr:DUF4469 domain-containing protein [Treponema sp.]